MRYIKLFLIISLIGLLGACESVEDTYPDFTRTGKKRYIAKCKDLTIQRGWKRFKFDWIKPVDESIDKIKIVWTSIEGRDSVIIEDENLTEYTTESIFGNVNYEFHFIYINKEGKESLPEIVYGKPYNEHSENLSTLNKISRKYFYSGDDLIICFNQNKSKIDKAKIYYTKNGEEVEAELTDEQLSQQSMIIEGIDPDSEASIRISMEVDDCFEPIDFPVYKLDRNTFIMNSDFISYLKIAYNIKNITPDFINSVETLEINTNLMSMEDIQHFNNLKNIYIGNKRYMHEDYLMEWRVMLNVTDFMGSLNAVNRMHDIFGTQLTAYNKHFPTVYGPVVNRISHSPDLPEMQFFDDMDTWTITEFPKYDNYNTHLEYILDDDENTAWKPLEQNSEVLKHTITINMHEIREIKGIKIQQPRDINFSEQFFPTEVEIRYSDDPNEIVWKSPFQAVISNLYTGRGEVNVIEFPEPIQAKYFEIKIKDKTGYNNFTYLAGFIPYK